jgi:hypothetical protein
MCLIINSGNREKNVAKGDIICYKLVEYQNRKNGRKYASFYRHAPVVLNETYTSKLNCCSTGYRCVVFEGLHSFKFPINKKDHIVKKFHSKALIKCIIPKGANYYENDYEYASDTIIYTTEIIYD